MKKLIYLDNAATTKTAPKRRRFILQLAEARQTTGPLRLRQRATAAREDTSLPQKLSIMPFCIPVNTWKRRAMR